MALVPPALLVAAADSVVPGVLGFAAVLVSAAALLAWLYARTGYVLPSTAYMSFFQHLHELRQRLLRVAALFVFWTTAVVTLRFEPLRIGPLPLAAPVVDIYDNAASRAYVALVHLIAPSGVSVIVTRPTDAVAAQIQVGLLLAFVLTFPALAYELWAFLGPGLKPRERRALGRALPVAFVLFVAGAAFSTAFVVPMLFQTLYGFAAPLGAITFLAAGALVGMLVTYAFWFGLAFELPLALFLLVRLGIVAPTWYLRYWRHSTLAIFIVAAVITDPTWISQVIVGVVLLFLYWGGVAASFLARPTSPPRTPAKGPTAGRSP